MTQWPGGRARSFVPTGSNNTEACHGLEGGTKNLGLAGSLLQHIPDQLSILKAPALGCAARTHVLQVASLVDNHLINQSMGRLILHKSPVFRSKANQRFRIVDCDMLPCNSSSGNLAFTPYIA